MEVITLLIAAGAAAFFGYRLFTVLGRKTGHTPDLRPVTPSEDDAGNPAELSPAMADGEARSSWVVDMDPAEFLDGARKAYALIVEGFAKGDREALRPLLSTNVYGRYEKAISEREKNQQVSVTEIERIAEAKLLESTRDEGVFRVKVRFKADISTETKDKDGNVVSGDLTRLTTVEEIWTFEKDANSRDPNWKLAGVRTA
ncbi:Tim44/TimA family putative adaptor protein [Hyphobacterium sp. HN65]|uniref:Large ribosomal subunit protein mL45 n=1 Tax=Hyphobacterium lacteum TaxID=3116575 RepID=A0ABU7LSL1_9PROT|nr:Tim44/TimA family putative adaptor protein [Hyphobacterium sp. HN65]MEE2526636.1 Tim44/TimA family putative adaptor protein [Hyphobacterium sp. HN65]